MLVGTLIFLWAPVTCDMLTSHYFLCSIFTSALAFVFVITPTLGFSLNLASPSGLREPIAWGVDLIYFLFYSIPSLKFRLREVLQFRPVVVVNQMRSLI